MSASGLPASDRIVVALWRAGRVRAARQYCGHALARNDPARAVLYEHHDTLDATPGEVPRDGEVPALDFGLVVALVDRYRFHEALTVLRAVGLSKSDRRAKRLAAILEDALAPFPADADPSFSAALQLVRAGQAPSALRAIEEVLKQHVHAPEWLARRQRALDDLVRGGWFQGPEAVEPVTRETVLAKVRQRDLPGALEAAERAEAAELAGVLRRLVEETEGLFTEGPPVGLDEPTTVPMEGHGLGAFRIRMGLLSDADRTYRKILEEDPRDDRARRILADVIALRRALGEETVPMPRREISSVHWLSKKGPKRAAEWGAGHDTSPGRYARFGDGDEPDDPTDVVAVAEEAELLLKLGKAEQALAMFRILATRHPRRAAYERRIEEIEALIADRETVTGAITATHDLSELLAQAVPTDPRISVATLDEEYPSIVDDDDDPHAATLVDRLPLGDDDAT